MVQRQTDADTKRELAIAQLFAEKSNWYAHKYEARYAIIDYYLTDHKEKHRGDSIVGLLEVKSRPSYKHDDFETIIVSLNKWYHLFLAHEAFDVPGWFIFWYGKDYLVRTLNVKTFAPGKGCIVTLGGRTDRSDAPNDLEPVIEVPRHLLTTIATDVTLDLKPKNGSVIITKKEVEDET